MIFIWKPFWLSKTLKSFYYYYFFLILKKKKKKRNPRRITYIYRERGRQVCDSFLLSSNIILIFFYLCVWTGGWLGASTHHPKMPSSDYSLNIWNISKMATTRLFLFLWKKKNDSRSRIESQTYTHTRPIDDGRRRWWRLLVVRCRATYGRQTRQDYWDDASEIDLFQVSLPLSLLSDVYL